MRRKILTIILAALLFSCANTDGKSNSNVSNDATQTADQADMSDDAICGAAVQSYQDAYDAFDRECVVDEDCGWFDGLASCGCAGFGNANADPQVVFDAEENVRDCDQAMSGLRDAACQNNISCTYYVGMPLACEAGACVVSAVPQPTLLSLTIEPSTITLAQTGMTDMFFTVSIETDGFTNIDTSTIRLTLADTEASPTMATVDGPTITIEIPFTWVLGKQPGSYDIDAEVRGDGGEFAFAADLATLVIEP